MGVTPTLKGACLALIVALCPTGALAASPTLDAIKARDTLICGVNEGLLGFGLAGADGEWRGFDVDLCRALAAAILGDANKVRFEPLSAAARFEALSGGKVDVLSRNTTHTMQRDVDLGLAFPALTLFDGQGFIAAAETGLVSAQQLTGKMVCVLKGTTTEANLAYYASSLSLDFKVTTFANRAEMIAAYAAGTCDAYSADRTSLYADRAGMADPTAHVILPEAISKEPLGPVVRDTDPAFASIVQWTVAGLINAEEVGLTAEQATSGTGSADAKRLLAGADASAVKLGLTAGWLARAVGAVGNYAEMFELNLGAAGPLGMERGVNALWNKGGLLYAPPMW